MLMKSLHFSRHMKNRFLNLPKCQTNFNKLKKVSLVLISLNSPLKCGVYENLNLVKSFLSFKRSSDGILEIFSYAFNYLHEYNARLESVFYAKGPGSFTAIKITHIFLQTLALSLGIKLYSCNSFYFNQNTPIRAFGNKFFVLTRDGTILLQESPKEVSLDFALPHKIDLKVFDCNNTPLYILPPI